VALLTALLPAFVAGSVRAARSGTFAARFTLAYGLVIWLLVALVVVNEGTLFRLLPRVYFRSSSSPSRGRPSVYADMARAVGHLVGARSPA
jgi:hypothetical protein